MNIDEQVRFEELESKAKEIFLEHTEFRPQDWLDDDEREEYIELFDKMWR